LVFILAVASEAVHGEEGRLLLREVVGAAKLRKVQRPPKHLLHLSFSFSCKSKFENQRSAKEINARPPSLRNIY
jgi:hypothetical protein